MQHIPMNLIVNINELQSHPQQLVINNKRRIVAIVEDDVIEAYLVPASIFENILQNQQDCEDLQLIDKIESSISKKTEIDKLF